MYCVKCKNHTETLNITTFTTRNGRPMWKGICADCGKAKTQFIKTGSGLFNKPGRYTQRVEQTHQ